MVNYILSFDPGSEEIDHHLAPQFSLCPFCSVNFTAVLSEDRHLDTDSELVFRNLAKISSKKLASSSKKRLAAKPEPGQDLAFWRNISTEDVRELYEWYFDDFQAFGYTVEEYFKKVGLDYLSD